ncbi:MAG: helix-turn-helix transcriptional regulator [Planctomycetota bacterium]
MAKAKRVSRLLEIVTLLQSGRGWTAPKLAERFGISRTRIFEDIRALRDAGVPIETSPDGYAIAPSFFLPSVRLTPRELLALLFPSELFADGTENHQVLHSARVKLLSCLPERLRPGAEELLRRTSVLVPTGDVHSATFARLRRAVAEHRRVAVVYESRTSPRRRLELHPYGLAFRKHAWYLVAHSAEHGEVRKFRVSRVQDVELMPVTFEVPADFSVDDAFAGAWYVFSGQPRDICLWFSERVARFVRERRPLPGQRIQGLSDGSILFRATVNDLDEVAWWMIQYGGEARVEHPPELAEKVTALAEAAIEANRAARGRRRYPEPGRDAEGRAAEGEAEP